MAGSVATITILPYPKGIDNTQRCQIVRGTIALSAGTYPPGGFPLNWNNLQNTSGETIESIPLGGNSPSSTGSPAPFDMDVKSVANNLSQYGTGPSGFIYLWDNVLGNLHIFQVQQDGSGISGPLVEIGGALPHEVVFDTIQFEATFYRNN